MAVDVTTWLQRFAEEAGAPGPTPEQQELLLALAGVAAHTSERIAAPLSCWVVGRAGLDPAAALVVAQRLAEDLEGEAGTA